LLNRIAIGFEKSKEMALAGPQTDTHQHYVKMVQATLLLTQHHHMAQKIYQNTSET